MALYSRMTQSNQDLETVEIKSTIRENKLLALSSTSETIANTISDPMQQVEIWKWIFDKERRHDDVSARFAIESALTILNKNFSPNVLESSRSSNSITVAMSMRAELTTELMKMNCEYTVISFSATLPHSNFSAQSLLLSSLSSPSVLLRQILEISVNVYWEKQMMATQSFGENFGVPCKISAVHSVSQFFSVVSKTVDDLAKHCNFETQKGANVGIFDVVDNAVQQNIETIRHTMIGKMLSDVEKNSDCKNSVALDKADLNQGANIFTVPVGTQLAFSSKYRPTESEMRRREDLFLSFSIFSLICTCSNNEQRYHNSRLFRIIFVLVSITELCMQLKWIIS
jgi:hypothetical protein